MKRLVIATLLLAAIAPSGARAKHIETYLGPTEPKREFPADFLPLLPQDWQADVQAWPWVDKRVGGWGAAVDPACDSGRAPVILVHGTLYDAEFWRANESSDGTITNVRQRFAAAGWCPHEVWAVSYNGTQGNFTYNELNAQEVYAFIQAVRTYLAARGVDASKVHVIGHSLGVTVVRRAAMLNPDLLDHMEAFVAIAGANHGTTACHGQGDAALSHVCEEVKPASAVSPMSPWLQELNAFGETPSGQTSAPRYLVMYSATADNFYVGPEAHSPRLEGACNVELGVMAHNTLARGVDAVALYQQWLRTDTLPAGRTCA